MSGASIDARETLALLELVLLKYPFILQCKPCEIRIFRLHKSSPANFAGHFAGPQQFSMALRWP